MISLFQSLTELQQAMQTGSTILQTTGNSGGGGGDFTVTSPDNDKLDKEIINNKFTGQNKTDGKVDQSAFPPNPEVAFLYVNTPLMRITKTRI